MCNVGIGNQQLRYWLAVGAELSGGRNCPLRALHTLTTARRNATNGTKNTRLAYRWLPMACRSRSAAAEGAPPLVEVILPNLGGGRAAGLEDFSLLLALRADRVGTALEDFVDR